jgi:hypothetical protein
MCTLKKQDFQYSNKFPVISLPGAGVQKILTASSYREFACAPVRIKGDKRLQTPAFR